MTDRHAGYVVALDKNMREDDAQAILSAISMIRGVLAVKPVESDPMSEIAGIRVRREILRKMYEAFEGA